MYGCAGAVNSCSAGRELDDAAAIHDGDAIANLAHQPEVVRDEEIRQAELLLQIEQQVHDLRLHRHVERRHGFVADDERRLEGERAREADALPLAAAEFVRILRAGIGIEPDQLEKLRTRARCSSRDPELVNDQRLLDDGAHAHARVEGRIRILKHDLEMPPRAAQVARRQRANVHVLEPNVA